MHVLSRRMRRRLVRHHLPLAIGSALGTLAVRGLTTSEQAVFRWSMATGYVALALLVATLATGPLNVLRGRANPVSSDLRRDIGIWGGLLSVAHFVFGLQVHLKHRWLYWLREGSLLPRTDFFGFANHTGLVATLIAVLLLVLSNDYYLRRLGTVRWKSLQRWNYALFALVIVHGAAYQLIEKRIAGFVVAFAGLSVCGIAIQAVGFWRVRSRSERRSIETGPSGS
jgi:sulfoxide reductase heme-binding subunit YedZ